MKGFSKL